MATNATNTLENAALEHILGATQSTPPASVWVKLHTGDPGDSGTSNPAGETTRQQASFSTATGGSATTSGVITWSSISTSETITHFSIWDDQTAGSALYYGSFAVSVAAVAGNDLTIATGSLTVSHGGNLTTVAANQLLNHFLSATAMTFDSTLHVQLHTGNPGSNATSSVAQENTREVLGSTSFVSGGVRDNSAAVEWTSVAASETFTHWSLWTAATGGTALFQAPMDSAVVVSAGDTFRFDAASLVFSLT